MGFIKLDAAAIEILRAVSDGVQIRDSAGNVIGIFQPAPPVYEEGEIPPTSEEELVRRENNPIKYSTEEVLHRLRNHL